MIKGIIIGALGMYIYLVHPDKIQDVLVWSKDTTVYVLDWLSSTIKKS
jgi:hypothetical protein